MTKRDEAATAAMDLPVAHRDEEPAGAPEPEARTRNLGEIRVALVSEQNGPDTMTIQPGAFDDVRAAEKSIKDLGDDGREFVVLRLVSRHRVSVETIVRRTVTEVRP